MKDSPHDARRIVKLKIHHTFYENSVTASTHYLIKMFSMSVTRDRSAPAVPRRGERVKSNKQVTAATMKDVALKAKVSTATVSRALMNPDKVSQSTRSRVEQAALEVGYFPQSMGRNVKRNESRTILVIVPDICDPFFSEIIRGIEVTAAEQGYLVLIGDCAHQNQKEKTFLNLIITKQIDGMVLLSSRLPFDASVEEQRNLPPMVMSNEFAPELELPTEHIDNLTAAFNAMNYLLDLGHKRIGCIAGPEDMPLCHYRLQGYVQALRRSGIVVDPHYIARGDFTFEAGANALKQLLEQPLPPTAVFCHSDVMALGALSWAKRQGLKVPDDLSIIGFDNIALAEFCDPPLTTVAQPRFDIGREAMLLLLDQMQGQNVSSGSRLMDCELIIRGSTRALP
ncbi:DNA-binding transcriptional regulator CytR [Salmonella enterica subsp. enterica serovar Typhimurium str. 14028S]|nr:DNA-binding transcriptional regulator CytR [Salmonella enterica subsp. enterica serovar Typhimurium str. 14028S]